MQRAWSPSSTPWTTPTNDLERAVRFYDAVLQPLGLRRCDTSAEANWDDWVGWGRYEQGGTHELALWVCRPYNGAPATPGNGTASLYWGTGADANGTSLVASAAVALTASQTNLTWDMELLVRCRALGVTGSLMAVGMFSANVAVLASTLQPVMLPASAPAAVTVDLTQNFVLSPQFLRSGSTAETMQVHEFLFESLN